MRRIGAKVRTMKVKDWGRGEDQQGVAKKIACYRVPWRHGRAWKLPALIGTDFGKGSRRESAKIVEKKLSNI